MVKKLDVNANGKLDYDEAKPLIKEMTYASINYGPKVWAKRNLERLKADEDQELEFSFKELDKDRNCELDEEELAAYMFKLFEEIRREKGGDRYAKVGKQYNAQELKDIEHAIK